MIAILIALVTALAGMTDTCPVPADASTSASSTAPAAAHAKSASSNPFAEPARDVLAHAACGNCHRPGLKTTDPRALKIFNLHDPVWYGAMTDDQIRSLKNRIEHSSGIDDGDRAAVLSFVDCKLTGACAPPHPEESP